MEWIERVLRDGPLRTAREAAAGERFGDVAASQLLALIPDALRDRSAWSGYGGTTIARRLVDAFFRSQNGWTPAAALSVADAALAVAKQSDTRTPALLSRAHMARAAALGILSRYDDAFDTLISLRREITN